MDNRENGMEMEKNQAKHASNSTSPSLNSESSSQERPIAAMHYPPRQVSLANTRLKEDPAPTVGGEKVRKSILPSENHPDSTVDQPSSSESASAATIKSPLAGPSGPAATAPNPEAAAAVEATIMTVEQPAIKQPSKIWNRRVIVTVMSILVALAVIMSGLALYVFWPHKTTPDGDLANGIEPLWSKPAVVKFEEDFSDEFEPYTVYLPDRQLVAVIVPVKKKGTYIELAAEDGAKTGQAKSLNPCNFWKGDRYVEHNGKIECESPDTQGSDNAAAKANGNENSNAADKSTTGASDQKNSPSGEIIYTRNKLQITANPTNGAESKQLIGYVNDRLAWIDDLDNAGYATVANNTVFVTTRAGKNQVKVQAYQPRTTAAPAAKADRIYQIDTRAITKLDLKNLVYPVNSCAASTISLNQVLPTAPPENAQDTCWVKLINGQSQGTSGGQQEGSTPPVYQLRAANPEQPWVGNGLDHPDPTLDTVLVDLNQDGYLDYLVAIKYSQTQTTKPVYETDWFGDQVLVQEGKTTQVNKTSFVAVIHHPSRPKNPYLMFLTQRDDQTAKKDIAKNLFDSIFKDGKSPEADAAAKSVFTFKDGVLSYGTGNGQNPILRVKLENRRGVPIVTQLEQAPTTK